MLFSSPADREHTIDTHIVIHSRNDGVCNAYQDDFPENGVLGYESLVRGLFYRVQGYQKLSIYYIKGTNQFLK